MPRSDSCVRCYVSALVADLISLQIRDVIVRVFFLILTFEYLLGSDLMCLILFLMVVFVVFDNIIITAFDICWWPETCSFVIVLLKHTV